MLQSLQVHLSSMLAWIMSPFTLKLMLKWIEWLFMMSSELTCLLKIGVPLSGVVFNPGSGATFASLQVYKGCLLLVNVLNGGSCLLVCVLFVDRMKKIRNTCGLVVPLCNL